MASFTSGHIALPTDNASTHNGVLLNTSTGLIDGTFTTVSAQDWAGVIPGTALALGQETGAHTNLYLYDFTFALTHTVAMGADTHGITSDYASTFYVTLAGVPATMKTVTPSGTVGGTVYTLGHGGISGSAVSPNGGILYYGEDVVGAPIHRWNITGNVAMSDLIPSTGIRQIADNMICLPLGARAGDVMIAVTENIATDIWKIERWTSAGVLAQTYPLPTTSDADGTETIQLSVDLRYPNTFWVRTFPTSDGNTTVMTMYSLNGTILQQFTTVTNPADPNTVAPSCPSIGWSQPLTPAPPEGPFIPDVPAETFVGIYEPGRSMVRIRQAGLPALAGNVTQFIGRSEVQMQPGLGTTDPTVSPVIGMAWSGDNAETFGTERLLPLGKEGDYYTRAYQHTVGSMRQPVVKVRCSDDVTFVATDLFVTRESGTN